MPQSEKTMFPDELVQEIKELFPHYPEQDAALIPAMHLIQERFGHISDDSIITLSEIIDIAPAKILGVMSFYTMFRREPSGKFHINVCKNLSCTLVGSRAILTYLEEKLNIKAGETTEDKVFSLGGVECLGACSEAPVMEIDGVYYMRLSEEKVDQILEGYRIRAKEY